MQEIIQKKHIEIRHAEYPAVITIVPSGWGNMYHVIHEDPENGNFDHSHEFLSKDRVQLRYNIKL